MENVFWYFVAIGAGLTFGVLAVLAPAAAVYKWIKKRGNKHDY